jgi:hypothetical protein
MDERDLFRIAAAVEQQALPWRNRLQRRAASGTNQVSQNIADVTAATTETARSCWCWVERRLAASCSRFRPGVALEGVWAVGVSGGS